MTASGTSYKFEKLLNFFSEEKGVSMDLLKKFTDPHALEVLAACGEHLFPLIRYYRDAEGLSVDVLFSFSLGSITQFAYFDKRLLFHQWLTSHQLTMPEALTRKKYDRAFNIQLLCDTSGIEFLNRSVLSHPKAKWQQQLEEIVEQDCSKYKATLLRDSLLPKIAPEAKLEERFLQFLLLQRKIISSQTSELGPSAEGTQVTAPITKPSV